MRIELSAREIERLGKEEIALGYWTEGKKFVYIAKCNKEDLREEAEAIENISTSKR